MRETPRTVVEFSPSHVDVAAVAKDVMARSLVPHIGAGRSRVTRAVTASDKCFSLSRLGLGEEFLLEKCAIT